eukprot:7664336-Pyramimonas_sp.AAC.1
MDRTPFSKTCFSENYLGVRNLAGESLENDDRDALLRTESGQLTNRRVRVGSLSPPAKTAHVARAPWKKPGSVG